MLIVGWPASQAWVSARRAAETTRRRLVTEAEEWVRLGRGDDGLLSPAELAEAGAWFAGPDAADLGIDADVLALVHASREAIDSEVRNEETRAPARAPGLRKSWPPRGESGFGYYTAREPR